MKKIILLSLLFSLINIPIVAAEENPVKIRVNKTILLDAVPFTAQAPFGNWADQRQQNGCEEASALMVIKWARQQTLTKEIALKEITKLADWLKKKHGESRDSSAQDTVNWIFKEYFKYDKVQLKKMATLNDIIGELTKGNLIVAPMNGQLLRNPNFKQPGPERHMLVIIGFDPIKKQFITNDPGTRNGANYRYNYTTLYNAIRDYPTGYNKPIKKVEKNIIVISK
jgi:hypothetical protein